MVGVATSQLGGEATVHRHSRDLPKTNWGGAMERAKVNGVELEYEVEGSGEAVLLISPMLAGAFLPFLSAPALVDRYRLVRYHKRGWGGSTHTTPPVRIEDHAADAAALLDHLGASRAHVAGHSSGGAVALELAFERPDLVHTVALLEPSLLGVPSSQTFFERAAPSLEAYHGGDHQGAIAGFLSLVSGLDWETCRAVIDEHVPGGVAQSIRDAETLFGVELPALSAWEFGPEQAAAIAQPVLSVLGTETDRLWVEVAELLHSWFPQVEELAVDGVGHLLQMQRAEPVARGLAAFLGRHPMLPVEEGSSDARARSNQRLFAASA
jgi:pimeloyl-ACP methyl ester carboxylesterase